jgi:hypothetical protein
MAARNFKLDMQEVLNCQLPVWYEKFSEYTAKTSFISLSEDFISYLRRDGIVLPEGCCFPQFESQNQFSDDNSEEWSDDNDDSGGQSAPTFRDLTQEIELCIEDLGGVVFPKLNWSSPRDAYWVLPGNTLKCSSPADVYLLLKSSDFIHHDLSRVFEYCTDGDGISAPPSGYKLCLRKWVAVNPGSEFRCFVRDSILIAISQRDTSTYYQHVSKDKDAIRGDICQFHSSVLHRKFSNSSYTFDVYQNKEGCYRLIDINPFGEMTDPLLFSWDELRNWVCPPQGGVSPTSPQIRVIDSEGTIRPSDLELSRLPKDVADLKSSEGIEEFVKMFKSENLGQ